MSEIYSFRGSGLIKDIARDSGLLPEQVAHIIQTAPLRYKVFKIKKRTSGLREIAQPAKEVKWIQRWLVSKMRSYLPVHRAATAYEAGSSIKKNAYSHSHQNYLLKLDFKNFFPSIVQSDVLAHLARHTKFSDSDASLICRSCLWAKNRAFPLQLCIGAPSSPFISNSIMFEFDEFLGLRAEEKGVIYTRYADDISLSSNDKGALSSFEDIVESFLRELDYPKIQLNQSKTLHSSRGGRRVVTGVIITPDGKLSSGRGRKRLIRSMAHRYSLGVLSDDEIERMEGLVNFVESIEPGFSRKVKGWKAPRS